MARRPVLHHAICWAVAAAHVAIGTIDVTRTIAAAVGSAGSWSFGPSLSIPVFNGGRLKANVDIAKSGAQQQYLAWKQTVLRGIEEVESALVSHPKVAEAAVVGYPHDLKGQGIYCYVTLNMGENGDDALKKDLVAHVRREIGPIASPDLIEFSPGLPKTRSGKIMRRILRKIAEDDYGSLGDTSTLADPAVVDDLITNRQNRRMI